MHCYTTRDVYCYLQLKKNALQDISAGGLVLHAKNFASALEENVVPKLINRFSWTLHKICEYEISLSHIFPFMDRIQGHIRENTYHRKSVYSHAYPSLTYFTD